jgi:hypothetical protein
VKQKAWGELELGNNKNGVMSFREKKSEIQVKNNGSMFYQFLKSLERLYNGHLEMCNKNIIGNQFERNIGFSCVVRKQIVHFSKFTFILWFFIVISVSLATFYNEIWIQF